MYRQPTRWERRIAAIEAATQKGKFSTTLFLYSSEYRKLSAMGFLLDSPVHPFSNSQAIRVSWNHLTEYLLSEDEPISQYCFLKTDKFPKTDCFSDECFIKAFRCNLRRCLDPTAFVQAFKNIIENNCCF